VEDEPSSRNPLTLGRVSIRGVASRLEADSTEFTSARALYLAAHPTATMNFQLPDFLLFRIRPDAARFVAGFGKIFDLDRRAWEQLGLRTPP
jgi:putative heme iron utilization protein